MHSRRKLEAAYRDQIPYLWLTGWQYPDHNTRWQFYKRYRRSMRPLFKHTARTAVALELVDLVVQTVDGTEVPANAAKRRSYDAEQLRQLLERVEQAIGGLEAQNHWGADQRALRQRPRQQRLNLTDHDARSMRTRQWWMNPRMQPA